MQNSSQVKRKPYNQKPNLKSKKTTQKKSLKRKEEIFHQAEKLFSQYDYGTVSMKDIAKLVQISKPDLYYYFKSKRNLYLQLLEIIFKSFSQTIEKAMNQKGSPQRRLKNTIKAYLEFCLKKENISQLMLQKLPKKDKQILKQVAIYRNQIAFQLEPLVKEVLETKPGKSNLNSHLVSYFLVALLDSLINRNIIKEKKLTIQQTTNQIMVLMFS